MKPFDWTRLFTRPWKVYTQLVFWLVVFGLYILLKEYPQRMTGATLICNVLQEVLELAIPSYCQNLLIVPLFRRGRWLVGAALYLVQVGLLLWLLPYILNAVGWVFGWVFAVRDLVDWRREHITFSVIAFTVMASFFKIGLDRVLLDREQKENELRHLKAQLNPHFLFNTLNNLYGLSVTGSPKLPDLMLQLSDLLRYSLYDTQQHYVPVQKELGYIKNYLELERIRLSDRTDIVLEAEGDFAGWSVAPLLLIVFIENAFKHFSAPRGQRGFVQVVLGLREGRLRLGVRNSLDPDDVRTDTGRGKDGPAYVWPDTGRGKGGSDDVRPDTGRDNGGSDDVRPANGPVKGGLGLKNARQRLALVYPKKHILVIRQEPEFFTVDLEIDLS